MGEPVGNAGTSSERAADVKEEELRFRIGQRVHAVGNPRRIGTVRYVGEVGGHAGEWVGIDWDDGEGKHDGCVAGVRYFTARDEKSASLVRSKILTAGISLVEALHQRYRGESTKEEEDEMYVLSSGNKRVPIQLLGKNKFEEKFKHFDEMHGASVSYFGVSSVDPTNVIRSLIPNVKELDLTGSLLSRWQDVNSICDALPALEILDLTDNLMETDIPELTSLKSIQILVLNHCSIAWEKVEILEKCLLSIEELHLTGNKIRMTMPVPSGPSITHVPGFDSLRLLNLDDNCISLWDEVLHLSRLRSLEQLHLNKNMLKKVSYPTNHPLVSTQDRCCIAFEKLQCLLLGSNEINDLASVDSFNLFPSLVDVRLSENPIADPAKGGLPRFVLIARLAKVKTLNGSEISARERNESEIRYVRLVMTKMKLDDPKELSLQHPRFAELKALHGLDDEKPSTGIAGPQKMGAGLICMKWNTD
ncbi:hypothetical protein AXF42_Ash010358 [Apostasia shenzhenica]|uniref:CAP-Gly domain-containing protein n=1 Tax=Apostasia shenzhenica TaxID=1088818 RepID=A0A2I0BDR9_9ASPA|nr:hypothetical protein AXF42_Ash010358 [Apostasia shenzhenica]